MRWAWLLIAIALLPMGCGSKGGHKPVQGTVTLDGQPLDGASVHFYSDEKGGPSAGALTDSSGKFVIVGQDKKGLPPGRYKVTVSKIKGGVTDEPVVAAVTDADTKNDLPAIYSDPSKTILSFSVTGDGTPIEIKLDSKRKN